MNIQNTSSTLFYRAVILIAIPLVGLAYFNGVILLIRGHETQARIVKVVSSSVRSPQTAYLDANGRRIVTEHGRVFNKEAGTIVTVTETNDLAYNGSRLKLFMWLLTAPAALISYYHLSKSNNCSTAKKDWGMLYFILSIVAGGLFFLFL